VIRFGAVLVPGRVWPGGLHYLKNVFRLLGGRPELGVEPVLFAPPDAEAELAVLRPALTVPPVLDPALGRRAGLRLAAALALGADPVVRRLFDERRIDVAFENASFHGWRIGRPTIAWFPDLQHRRMPHLFGRRRYWRREIGFRAQVAAGRSVLLSSREAEADCVRFYPGARGRTFAVPFAVPLPEPLPDGGAVAAAAARHGLPARYVHLPNQFWAHKDHRTAVEAAALLRDRGAEATVVCTGPVDDPRDPAHVPALLARIAELGLGDRFRVLGAIPYAEMTAIMRGARAVLNPSRFEGWSTTVEEAKALGVPLLLSDIPVHREQAPAASFFPCGDAGALAGLLARTAEGPPSPAAGLDASRLRADAETRVADFAEAFAAMVRAAAGRRA
jgi:glycosyltransferase involved in cell wall biosynthesis